MIIDIIDTPGPGSYILPSDFGHVISQKALNSTHMSFRNSFTGQSRTSVSGGSHRPGTSASSKKLQNFLSNAKGNVFESPNKRDSSTNHSNASPDKSIGKNASMSLEENHEVQAINDPVKEEDPVAEATNRDPPK